METHKRQAAFYFALALVLFLVSHFLNNSEFFKQSLSKKVKQFSEKLFEKEVFLENKLAELAENNTQNEFSLFSYSEFQHLFADGGIVLLAYENNKLVFWSTNALPFLNEITSRRNYESPLQKTPTGWFLSKTLKKKERTFVGLLLLKNEYPFENNYLRNKFNPVFGADENIEIIATETEYALPVKTKNGDYLFSLAEKNESSPNGLLRFFSLLFFFSGLICFLIFLFRVLEFYPKIKPIAFIILLLLLRATMLFFQYPAALYSLPLFDPAYHASSVLFPSLGDFLFNILAFAAIVWFTLKSISFDNLKTNETAKFFTGTVSLFLALCFHFPVFYLFERLIKDSSLDFTINNLFTLNFFSYIGLFIVWLLLATWFLLLKKVADFLSVFSNRKKFEFACIAVLLFALAAYFSDMENWQAVGISALIGTGILFVSKPDKSIFPVSVFAFLLFGFSLYAAYSIANFHKEKTESKALHFAEKLAAERDPIAEYIFNETAAQINNDRQIRNLITLLPQKSDDFFSRIEQKFLNDYLPKYEIRISVFDRKDSLIASTGKIQRGKNFYQSLENSSKPTSAESLFYCYESEEKINYLGKIIFRNKRDSLQTQNTVYIELEEKTAKTELGFPSLLLDKNIDNDKSLDEYSFAVYRDEKIISAYGDFAYSADEPAVQLHNEKYEFKSSAGWRHLFFKPNPKTLILLSRPQPTGFQKLTGVSFLFLLFSLLTLATTFVNSLFRKQKKESNSFRNRINFSVVSILSVFLLFIGFATIYYVEQEYSEKNRQAISEKIRSVLIEIENKSNNDENFYTKTDALGYTLGKFSKVFFSDINIYDTEGELIVSTRPRLFDMGFLARKINPEAWFSMQVQKKTLFVHTENIGKLNYLSAYAPLQNKQGETVAFLNLPYFAKQDGLQREILALLSALVNIYVLLIILAVALALFISGKITKPFEIIGENIRKVRLGVENKAIEWESDDEVGRLVTQYNLMLKKLGESAEALAKSERESAWREMAKQVAHEIKNPLTPMKLSVQQLQKAHSEQRPGWDKNIMRITQTLIEQIDTLAHIASEFSNFAKMPKTNNEKINIADALENVVALFNENENCKIEFHTKESDLFVFADREQLQRVFNNLLKNAIQSIPENREGKISATIERTNNKILIKISDNGTGISNEMKDKIFTPNFTTKSTGMGLGLAIVKSIVENAGGKIWFETKENEGSVFFISLSSI